MDEKSMLQSILLQNAHTTKINLWTGWGLFEIYRVNQIKKPDISYYKPIVNYIIAIFFKILNRSNFKIINITAKIIPEFIRF